MAKDRDLPAPHPGVHPAREAGAKLSDRRARPSPRAIGLVAAGLAVAALLGLLAVGLLNKAPVTGRSGLTRVGKPAPEIAMSLYDGGQFALSRHLGQPVVVNFWASWCPPCRAEAPMLERAWRAYEDRGLLIVGVDIQDAQQDGAAFLAEYGITYPNGLDRDGRITVDYGVIGLPVTFFVSKAGVVERRWVGALDEGRLRAWLEGLVAGASPTGEREGENPKAFFELRQGQ